MRSHLLPGAHARTCKKARQKPDHSYMRAGQSLRFRIGEKKKEDQFEIGFECNGDRLLYSDETIKELSSLLENSAVLKITNGSYIEKEGKFTYKANGAPYTLSLKDSQISGLKFFKDRFAELNLFGETEIRNTTSRGRNAGLIPIHSDPVKFICFFIIT